MFDRLSQTYPKRRTTQEPDKSRKQFTTHYYIDANSEETGELCRTEVCRGVFLSTLQCGEKMIHSLLKNNAVGGAMKPDERSTSSGEKIQ